VGSCEESGTESSRYATALASPSGLFGHVPERLRRLRVAIAGERGEAGGGKGQLVDRRLTVLFEVAQEPAGRDPRMPARGLTGAPATGSARTIEEEPTLWRFRIYGASCTCVRCPLKLKVYPTGKIGSIAEVTVKLTAFVWP